jgi:hypothetical protein
MDESTALSTFLPKIPPEDTPLPTYDFSRHNNKKQLRTPNQVDDESLLTSSTIDASNPHTSNTKILSIFKILIFTNKNK